MSRLLCIVVVFIIGFFPGVVAQQNESEYLFRNWSTSEGLPQSHITDLCQDPFGLIWVTTFDGIAKFDGNLITTYDQTNLAGLRSAFFTDLYKDADSSIYFVSDKDLVRYNSSVFTVIPLPVRANFRSSVCVSGPDSIYVSVDDRLFFYSQNKFTEITRNSASRIINIELISSTIGVATLNGPEFISRGNHQLISTSLTPCDGIHSDGKLFYSYTRDSILCFSAKDGSRIKSDAFTLRSPLALAMAHQNQIYTFSNDTVSYLHSDGHITHITADIFLSDHHICMLDARGNFWFGSHANGLYLVKKRFIRNFTLNQGEFAETYFVTKTKGGILSGACNNLYLNNGHRMSKSARNTEAFGLCIYDYYERSPDEVYMATYGHGLILTRNGTRDTLVPPEISGYNVYCLKETSDSLLYIGTNQGADLLNLNSGVVTKISSPETFVVYQFSEYSHGTTALATDHGVLISNGKNITERFDTVSGLKSNSVRSLLYDEDGNLWIGLAKYGLAVKFGEKIVSYPNGKGYLDKNILSITADSADNFWITTNHGLQRAARKNLLDYANSATGTIAVSTFGLSDGLISPEFNSHTQSKSCIKDDQLWLPGIRSVVCVSLKDQPQPENYPLSVHLKFNGNHVRDNEELNFLNAGSPNIQLSVEFADYSGYTHRYYEYKVSEIDSVWHTVSYGTKSEIRIDRNGCFTLEVRRPGEYSPIKRKFCVTGIANPTLLNTLWTLVFLLGAAGVTLTAFVIYNARKQKLLRTENENLAIRLVALQKQINPHFIFNCLNSLQSLFIMNKRREANAYLVRFASLLRAMIDYSRKEKSTLKDEIESCENYLELETLRFDESAFEYQINVSSGVSLSTITPSFLIQPFLENSLKHGTMPGKPLIISIDVTKNNNAIKITLKDNGQGPGSSGMQRTNSSGIRITAERLATFNRLYATSISFVIMDRKTLEAANTGTQVEITIGQ